jgi:ABC-type polar amino acid transport system ATPase subunit
MIEIADLNVHYGRVRALSAVSLSVEQGLMVFSVLVLVQIKSRGSVSAAQTAG